MLLLSIGVLLVYGTIAHAHNRGSLSKIHLFAVSVISGALLAVLTGVAGDTAHITSELQPGEAITNARNNHDSMVEGFLLMISLVTV